MDSQRGPAVRNLTVRLYAADVARLQELCARGMSESEAIRHALHTCPVFPE